MSSQQTQEESPNKKLKKDENSKSPSSSSAAAVSGPVVESKMDLHPFARGSVIEVSYQEGDVRLCDIIDRTSAGTDYRYYIHYRDFNRRMDEWISMDRIVSPPSVGAAKVRSQKYKKQKEQQQLQLQQQQQQSQRRRSAFLETPTSPPSPSLEETTRLTRRQRRRGRSATEDAFASNNQSQQNQNNNNNNRNGLIPVWTPDNGGKLKDQVVTVAAQELDEHEGLDEASLREHEEVTKVKNVQSIELGRYKMDTWYFSPIPTTSATSNSAFPTPSSSKTSMTTAAATTSSNAMTSIIKMVDCLYVCEFTFAFFVQRNQLVRYQSKIPCSEKHPPGNEIYRNKHLSMFEIDGNQERLYCQNLCYIAKLFLDHKTLYYDVDPFLFYVLCEVDERGFHPVGYYSKEKYSDVGYNLACILTFPCHQRKGYGRFLISFSYELTKKEEKVGSPEKPMSDLGQQAYKPYWTSTIIDFLLCSHDNYHDVDPNNMSIMDISKVTSIMAEDIIFTLNQLGILKYINGVYFIAAEQTLLQELAKKHPIKEPRVDPAKLHWSPYITDVKRDKFSIHSKKKSNQSDNATLSNNINNNNSSGSSSNQYSNTTPSQQYDNTHRSDSVIP